MATINPFQGPINYSVDVQSPFEAALGGFKIGAAGAEMQAQQQKRNLEIAAMEQAQKRQTELADLFKNPNASSADYERVVAFLPKDQAAIVIEGFGRKTKEQQANDLRMGGEVYSAIKSGQPNIAIQMLTDSAAAFRNSGREQEAKAAEASAKAIELNPTGAQTTVGLYMARLPGGTGYLEAADKALSTIRAEALAPSAVIKAVADADKAVADAKTAQATATNAPERAAADAAKAVADANKAKVDAQFAGPLAQASLNLNAAQIKNINSEIGNRAANLNLNIQTTQATVAEKLSSIQKNLTDVPADTRKLINESAVLAATSKQSADQFNDLAKRIESQGGNYGVASSASDFLKKIGGFQGGMTQLKQEYTRLRNTAAIKSLPPGPATDKDIAMALKGFPSDTATAGDLSSFLRGMGKLQDIDASINNAKTDWLSQNNGTLTRAKGTFVAGDYATKPGETFNDFSQRIIGDVSKRYDPTQPSSLVNQIPIPGNPTPGAANVRSQADAILRGGR